MGLEPQSCKTDAFTICVRVYRIWLIFMPICGFKWKVQLYFFIDRQSGSVQSEENADYHRWLMDYTLPELPVSVAQLLCSDKEITDAEIASISTSIVDCLYFSISNKTL